MITGRDVHIDAPLTNVVIAYRPEGMIADMVAPEVPVPKQSDMFWMWDVGEAFRTQDDLRAPGDEPNRMIVAVGTATFFAKNYALSLPVPYEDIENADANTILGERGARGEAIKDRLYLNWELRLARQVTSGSNVGSYSAVASGWTDHANCTPVDDLNTAINNQADYSGYRPNRAIFGGYAWRHFRECDQVIDRIYGTAGSGMGLNGRQVTIENVKAMFELDDVLVGGAYRNTAEEGQAHSLSMIWHDNVLVYYAPQQPRKDKPSFMYSFRWNKIMNMQAEVHQRPRAKAEEVHVGYYQDEKICAKALSFLITGVGSSQ